MYEHDMGLNGRMYKIFIQGLVQGVGFRPYIYRKAKELNCFGSVRNTGHGVEIIIDDKDFMKKLTDLPPLAKITKYSVKKIDSSDCFSDFVILESIVSEGETMLPADIFMCPDCQRELKDAANRRHEYYFITCTNCGPRFSMIEDYPYDRPLTSMKDFKMCPACKKEYVDPLNRRYHAQTIACKECGPKLRLIEAGKDRSGASDKETIKRAVHLITSGNPVSIKGVGGFHTCSLCDDSSVRKVRELFKRPHKPYAIMVKDIGMAQRVANVSLQEKELLLSPQRPIVVLSKKKKDDYRSVTELDTVGVMLPYTALHYLLFDFIDEPLLMTSCNIPGEPVATSEQIGTYFLTHERTIVNRCDDSVMEVIGETRFYLRRSRGFTPLPVQLPFSCEDTIAVGAEMNNVICTTKKDKCYLSQYIGDTSKYATFEFFKQAIAQQIQLTRCQPTVVACDLHPGYASTGFAKEIAEEYHAALLPIQHHNAHVASVAAEHRLTDYVGVAMDGLGYGDDGKLWGGEVFLVKNNNDFTRIGHLEEQPQLGGDSATIYPKKMLFGVLSKILSEPEIKKLKLFDEKETRLYLQVLRDGFNVQYTTSTGRVLDAVAALLGVCDHRTYDGRPAMLLESVATKSLECKPRFSKKQGKTVLLSAPLFEFLLENRKETVGSLAATAQIYIAEGFFDIAKKAAGSKLPIVCSGGVAYNRMISGYMLTHGVLVNKEIPAGDGGICYGQAYLANLQNQS